MIEFVFGYAVARNGVQDREINLFVRSVKINEEVVNFVDDFLRSSVLPVNLVDDDDDGQFLFQRFRQHVTGLRQRAFGSVNQQGYAVGQFQHAFDFAAEIGVSGSVQNVDLGFAKMDGGVFGHDRDAALAFQIHGIHDALDDFFVGAIQAGLFEHGVNQRGFAVVYVSDDGDVANVFSGVF